MWDGSEHVVETPISRIASRQRSANGKASFAGRAAIKVPEAAVQARRRFSAGAGVFGMGGVPNRFRRKGIICEDTIIFAESFTGVGT